MGKQPPPRALLLIRKIDGWLLRPWSWIVLFLVGALVRILQFGAIPAGFNQDEASTAYDAYALLHAGIDRTGHHLPVMLVAWGSGMDAIASYFAIPSIALLGPTIVAARIPHLLAGLLALIVFPLLVWRTVDRRAALLALFLLVINPWHIMISRWGLDPNFFPLLFLCGVYCLVRGMRSSSWLAASAILFALSLYAYGTAFLTVPVFLFLSSFVLLVRQHVRMRQFVLPLCLFAVVALPIAWYVLVNTYGFPSVETPFFSIPKLPGVPRFATVSVMGGHASSLFATLLHNLRDLWRLVWTQDDGLPWNAIPGFGTLYLFSTPFVLLGIAACVERSVRLHDDLSIFFLAWLLSAIVLGAVLSVNINRINIIFFPLIFFLAMGLRSLMSTRAAAAGIVAGYTIAFVLFSLSYFRDYPAMIGPPFFASFMDAVDAAASRTAGPICITDHVNMPYIFVLYRERVDPRVFLRTVRYEDPHAEFDRVLAFDRYTFGLSRCDPSHMSAYVLDKGEAAAFQKNTDMQEYSFPLYTAFVRT